MYYDVIPDKAPLFVAKFQEVINLLKTFPGHKESFLYQRVDDPHSYAIMSEWNDEQAFYAFLKSDTFRQVTTWGREQILRGRPKHKIYPRSEDLGPPSH
jgi:heme-degrading monooxygenase HmoA